MLPGPGKLNNSNNHNSYNNISIIGSAEEGGGTSSFPHILAHSAFLRQLDVHARPDASESKFRLITG